MSALRKFLCQVLSFFSKLLGCEPSPPSPQVGRIEFTVIGPVSEKTPVSPPSQADHINVKVGHISEQ